MSIPDGKAPVLPAKEKEFSIVYAYQDGLYVNLSSRCPTACKFCIKFSWEYQYRGYNLKLPKDPTVQAVLAAAGDVSRPREIVFCGYGESTYRLDAMEELSEVFRKKGARRIRLNTIGLGSLIHGRDIAPELGRIVDAVSVSLNTMDPAQYVEMLRPLPQFRDRAFSAVQDFIRSCAKHVGETTVTAVQMPNVDPEPVRRFAESAGAAFRLRPYLDDYEDA
jgi:TatD DNase family protein